LKEILRDKDETRTQKERLWLPCRHVHGQECQSLHSRQMTYLHLTVANFSSIWFGQLLAAISWCRERLGNSKFLLLAFCFLISRWLWRWISLEFSHVLLVFPWPWR
jgi:hypothetical protein